MAYPTGYTKYQEITIDHTKVSADLTDYVVYINLADLVKAGADIFDTCRTDGGDIRATKSDGTTQLATELVAIDTTAKTGELYVKFTGTLSSTVDTIIRIYYNGTDTALATTDTYGRNAVWTAFLGVWHLGSTTDSTGNGNTLTAVGSPTSVSGKLGTATDFSGTAQRYDTSNAVSMTRGGNYTWSWWVNADVQNHYIMDHGSSSGGNTRILSYIDGGTPKAFKGWFMGNEVATANNSATTGTWHKLMMNKAGGTGATAKLYFNGAYIGSTTVSTAGSATNKLTIGGAIDGGSNFNGKIDEMRVHSNIFSDAWETTEYNNQNSASTFYATGNEAGGTTDVSTTPSVLACTFSLPASTVTAVRNVSSTPAVLACTFSLPAPAITGNSSVSPSPLVATFSLPTSNVITPDSNVVPAVLVATFSLPSATVTAESNASVASSVLSATFSLPAPTVTLGVAITVTPDVLNATFSTPAPSVSVVSNMVANPAVLVATFSLPVARAVGDFWQNKFPVASDPFVDKVYNAGDNWSDKY